MQSPKNAKSNFGKYLLQKKFTPKVIQAKSTKNLNISLGANQTLTSFTAFDNKNRYKFDSSHHQRTIDSDLDRDQISQRLNAISRQNQKLRSQNQFLRIELNKIKKQKQDPAINKQKIKFYSRQHSKQQTGDLRGTIKKDPLTSSQQGDVKQLRNKVQVLSKQCRMYEQVIDKMQITIKRLTDQNRLAQSKHKSQGKGSDKLKQTKNEELSNLKDKVNFIMKQYTELESKMHSNQLEWVIWKEQWITEKNIYLNRIKVLQYKIKGEKKF